MLDPHSWLPQAKALSIGQQQRVPHDCGDGNVMIVEHRHDCYRAHCFRCNDDGYQPKQASLHELAVAHREQAHADGQVRSTATPPVPVVTDLQEWTQPARLWLYRAGISPKDIARLGIYFHPPSKRVVLPVVQQGEVVYWTARAVEKGQQPKYLNPRVSADVIPAYGTGDVVVLTEDILSAIKVGKVTEAWSLLGTKCKPCIVMAAVQSGKPCVVWLDGDDAGRHGASKTVRALRAAGVSTVRINSERDPKTYSTKEIRSMVADAIKELE